MSFRELGILIVGLFLLGLCYLIIRWEANNFEEMENNLRDQVDSYDDITTEELHEDEHDQLLWKGTVKSTRMEIWRQPTLFDDQGSSFDGLHRGEKNLKTFDAHHEVTVDLELDPWNPLRQLTRAWQEWGRPTRRIRMDGPLSQLLIYSADDNVLEAQSWLGRWNQPQAVERLLEFHRVYVIDEPNVIRAQFYKHDDDFTVLHDKARKLQELVAMT